jgi:Mor transcription activator family
MINAESIMMELEKFIYLEVIYAHGEKSALGCASALFDCLWLNFRKQAIYIPTSDRSELQRRNDAIWREFTGTNHAELSVKYRLSLQQIYSITRNMRANTLASNAPNDKPSANSHNKQIAILVIEEYLPVELIKFGLSGVEAETLSQKVAAYLCHNFPGVVIRITDALKDARNNCLLNERSHCLG